MKKTIAKYVAVFGLLLLAFFSCKKNNHDTLVTLGDENYIIGIDEIYPQKYRFEWPTIDTTHHYSLKIDTIKDANGTIISIDTTLLPPLNEYVFPPDLCGEFLIKGIRKGGNETLHNEIFPDPDSSLYNKILADGMNIRLRILEQKNAYAEVELREYNNSGENPIETENVYLYGDGNTGEFTLCFDATVPSGIIVQNYAYLLTGVFDSIKEGNDYIKGIRDVRLWHLVKGRNGNAQYYINTGGQRLYMDSVNFAERVKTIEEIENE